ncbi:2455_t:CDS:2 [Paraglomus occultum]|uniref:2455_t:CDS:1 n=1 Tax=Paraglomus occultum TaxID=144539 RepID=A0A9N9A271_9GLOM|nr:2455_t:CDS:2 [Paraglomus occultum]
MTWPLFVKNCKWITWNISDMVPQVMSIIYKGTGSLKNSVVKVFKSSVLSDAIAQEINLLKWLKECNAPHTIRIKENGNQWVTLVPICNICCLSSPSSFQKCHWIQGIEALKWLHDKGYVHWDIRPENIMQAGGNLVLSDFGSCVQIGSTIFEGTTRFASDSIITQLQASLIVDFQPSDDLHPLLRVAQWCDMNPSYWSNLHACDTNTNTELNKIQRFWQIQTSNLVKFTDAIPVHDDLANVFNSNWY